MTISNQGNQWELIDPPRYQEASARGEGNTSCIHQTLTRHILRKGERGDGDGDVYGDHHWSNEGLKKVKKFISNSWNVFTMIVFYVFFYKRGFSQFFTFYCGSLPDSVTGNQLCVTTFFPTTSLGLNSVSHRVSVFSRGDTRWRQIHRSLVEVH